MNIKSGLLTTEFWAVVGWIMKNGILFLVMFGRIKPEDSTAAQAALNQLYAAVGMAAAEAAALWKYVSVRGQVKTTAIDAQVTMARTNGGRT